MTAAELTELDHLLASVGRGDPAAARSAADRVRSMALADLPGALQLASKLVELTAPDSGSRVRALAAHAHALCYANDFDTAVSRLREAGSIAERQGDRAELGPLWLTQVQPLARLGRLPEAADAARAARDCFRSLGSEDQAAKAGVNLGIVLRMLGRAGEALACFEESAEVLKSDPLARGMVESNRAEALLDLDRFDDAANAFERALITLASGGHDHAAAVVGGNLADLLSRRGDIDDALPRFDAAVACFERVGAAGDAARLTAEEAEALLAAGAYKKALRLYDRALVALRSSKLTRETARACLGAGMASLKLGHTQSAARLFSEALDTAELSGAAPLAAEARLMLAEAAGGTGDHPRAEQLAREALGGLEDRPLFRARVLATLSWLAIERASADEAAMFIDEGLGIAESLRIAPLASRFWHLRALLLRVTGRSTEAMEAFRRAIGYAESRRGAIRAEQLRTAFLESAERVYSDAASNALDIGAPWSIPEALGIVEHIKSRTLLEDAGAGAARAPDSREYQDCMRRLNTLYSRLGPSARGQVGTAPELLTQLAEIETRLDRLQDRQQAPWADHASPSDRSAVLNDLRRELDPSAAAVVFMEDRGSISAIIARADGVAVHRQLWSVRDASRLTRRVRFDVERSETSIGADRSASSSLDQLATVLATLRDGLAGATEIRIVPCRELHGLPLGAALLAADIGARSVSMIPGVGNAIMISRRARSDDRPPRVLVIGVADQLAPEAEDEAIEISSLHPSSRVLVGTEAAADTVLDAMGNADLIHFAGHGVFDQDFPMSSRLLLGDRWITARELRGRLRPGSLAVMSACDTGQSAGGEDHYGLPRALLAAGASGVLGSLWRVRDDFARGAMVHLHRLLAEKRDCRVRTLAGALSSLQAEYLASGTPWTVWGGLYVKGALQ